VTSTRGRVVLLDSNAAGNALANLLNRILGLLG
jgi:hypothetical protein